MAWEPIGTGNEYTGDAPCDAFAGALSRIAEAYRDRFDRLPTLYEVLYSLRTVLQAGAPDLLHDPERADEPWLSLTPASAPPPLDDYEGAWIEDPQPEGTHIVEAKSTGEDVLRCRIRVSGRTLEVVYEWIGAPSSDDNAQRLIEHVLLRGFTRDHYAAEVDEVAYISLLDPSRRTTAPYPGA